jgi:hypothetical protein
LPLFCLHDSFRVSALQCELFSIAMHAPGSRQFHFWAPAFY